MKYHLKPVQRYRKLEPSYEGLHMGTHRIRLTQRFADRFSGIRRVRLSYDAKARVICLSASKTHKGPAGPDIYRISRDARGVAFIYCSTLSRVMPHGRYRFVRQTAEGYICTHDLTTRAGKK
jgi:hypothetical protein